MTEIPGDDAESIYSRPAKPGGPVDPPDQPRTLYGEVVARKDNDRRPIVPAWMRSKHQRRDVRRWALGYTAHTIVYHLTRSPKYLVKTLWYAPVGAVRIAGRTKHWASAEEGNWHLRQDAANRNDASTWMSLDRVRERQSSWRWWVVAAGALLVAVALCVVLNLPAWSRWAALATTMPVLARFGRPIGKPITDRVYRGPVFRKLTADMTRKAIIATGQVKDPEAITFHQDIGRDGPGWLAVVDLPDGVVATDVIEKRDQLAGGFRLPKPQVWPSPAAGAHPGRLHIWVADRPVTEMKPPAWPLLKDGQTDYFKPSPYGHDPRMRLVNWPLAERNSLMGGIPGSGKSLYIRAIVLGAVLDPLVVPALFELKGTGDYDPLEPLCPPGLFASGADEATKLAAWRGLLWLERECDQRGERVKHWVRQGLNSENKVNRAMAERDPRLRPILAVFDEIQELFTDKDMGKQAVKVAVSVTKRGRALGIHIIWGTQRIDNQSIPRGISSNVANRACLAVTSHTETDMVLPTGSYSRGARPTEFEPSTGEDPKDSGWSWVCGLGPMQPVRSLYLDNAAAAAVVARALAMREAQGRPAEPVKVQVRNILADVRSVWHDGGDALWSELIVPRLQKLDPDAYGDLTVEIFGARMAAAKVPTVQIGRVISGKKYSRKGVRYTELQAAIEVTTRPSFRDLEAGD